MMVLNIIYIILIVPLTIYSGYTIQTLWHWFFVPLGMIELGLAHALKKPVVLVSSNEEDVPFNLKHIRVIYYDVTDPFWGTKLLDKVAENILSAIQNPEEAIFKGEESK